MLKFLAPLVALSLLTSATPASATKMIAWAAGGYNDYEPYLTGWYLRIDYDIDLAQLSTTPNGYRLWWDESLGTPSPIKSLTLNVRGTEGGRYSLSDFTEFELLRNPHQYMFRVRGPDDSLTFGPDWAHYLPIDPPGTPLTLDTPYRAHPDIETYAYLYGGPGERGYGGVAYNHVFHVERAPVPEPATWAMMIVGFGFTGAALRRRRPLLA